MVFFTRYSSTHFILLVIVFFIHIVLGVAVADAALPSARWIWIERKSQDTGEAFFRKVFRSDDTNATAKLRTIGYLADASVFLNGEFVTEVTGFGPVVDLDVTRFLKKGDNVIEVNARRRGELPTLFVQLDLSSGDGSRETIYSNQSWNASRKAAPLKWNNAIVIGDVASEFVLNESRSIDIDAYDDYTQWKRALETDEGSDPSLFQVAPGFQIELVRSAKEKEGSWVSMAVDPQGRLVIAREDKGLLRVTLDAGRKSSQTG